VQLEHSFSVPVGIDEAWRILIDIERIGPCMPGAAIDSVDGDEFTGTVKVKLGPINLTYKGKAAFVEKDEPAHRAVIDARGRDARGNGTAAAKITATLHEGGEWSTTVKVLTDLDITGKPAQFGRGVMVDVGNKLLGQFADSLAKTIRGGDAEAPEVAAAPAPPVEGAAAEPPASDSAASSPATEAAPAAGAPTADTPEAGTPADAPVAETAPAAAPAPTTIPADAAAAAAAPPLLPETAPGEAAPPAPARPAADDVEPIDLLQHAGPAIAKRLAPLAVALVVFLIAIRRRRRC
jgi:carbon monoxide dehydrogenase subunit G